MNKIDKEFKLVGMMRVKNEEKWLQQSILSLAPIADRIVILDDGSTDATPDICLSFPDLVEYHRQDEVTVDEVRDKNRLLNWVLKHEPDWVLALDGDEVLEDIAPTTIVNEIHLLDPLEPQFTVFYFHFLYFWNDPEYYRVEPGIYSNFWQPRLFTLRGQNIKYLRFLPTKHGSNFHCGSIPANLRYYPRRLDVKVKHYGYLEPERRKKKYRWYCQYDPERAAEGYYDHLTSEEGMILARWEERTEASSSSFVKDTIYYQYSRPEIIELIPETVKRVLDVGCGHGHLGRGIKNKIPTARVYGVELDSVAGQVARKLLDEVLVGNIETIKLPYQYEYFDCIILADVLEHLRDPWKVLLKLYRYLAKDGLMIISVPNIRNLRIIDKLLQGEWRYEEAGILDSTHLRFFTIKEIKRMLKKLGYKIIQTFGVQDMTLNPLTLPDSTFNREIGKNFEWGNLDQKTIQELHTVQLILQAKKANQLRVAKERKLTSIIIPVHNNLQMTQLCINSILTHTLEPFELIIIDNGSTDGTVEYLKTLESVIVIRNEQNEGYPKACNQGIVKAQGKYLVFLNNDVIVGDGWLGHLIDHLEDEENVGIVGACSNYVGGSQQVTAYYDDLYQFQIFAREFYWQNEGNYLLTYRLAGLCMLVKREVINKIGGFDERFGLGNFEDDDFCLRAAMAGFKMVVARDVYVHHFGSMTFKKNLREYEKLLAENWLKFKIKWNIDLELDDQKKVNLPVLIGQNNFPERYYIPLDY
ncbi:hypothetical protein BBF96_08195 [Anoxybacter fermentans]|uniref:Glycosyltransferase 2-like domain-containing protein n=1 Tax=Anoxybacter fermentans TaxID=1323375 RepID=A0A3S9SYM6_9FIRM|nr:glycosyltransferase [Anoxybacter fermentans]AZR73364.1 hypothetical protein BBF96_08195 [Anoxybacter fermentans]